VKINLAFEPRHASAIAAIVGALGGFAGLLLDPRTMMASYLVAWTAASAIPIGALAVLMISYLVRAGWTVDLHPLLSRTALTIPLFALLFIPVLIGMGTIYPWAGGAAHLSPFQSAYLSAPLFVVRSIIYFAVLTALAIWVTRAYGDDAAMKRAGSAGLIVWALVSSFAGIDWMESVEPGFHSSIYGLLKIAFDLLAGFGFAIVALMLTHRTRRMSNAAYAGTFLSVLLLWAYLHAMQYIIIWAGNIPDEIVWYLARLRNGWGIALWTLYIGQFIVPFFVLLSERARSSTVVLLWLGGATLALRYLEAIVLILPPLRPSAWALLDLPAAVLLVGGVAMLAWRNVERWLPLTGAAAAR
jgi:hypothetical protein